MEIDASTLGPYVMFLVSLFSGGGIVVTIVKMLATASERESEAYQRGVTDEQSRAQADREKLVGQVARLELEIEQLRAGLLRLAMGGDLTETQRAEVVAVLGHEVASGASDDG